MSPTQLKALELLYRAYEDDLPVIVDTKTMRKRHAGRQDTVSISRVIAMRLVKFGAARFARPHRNYLLITEAGMAIARDLSSAA